MVVVGLCLASGAPKVPNWHVRTASPMVRLEASSPVPIGYTPAEIARAYRVDAIDSRVGSGRLIAIVVAFHQPSIEADLGRFISAFGLPSIAGLESARPCDFARGPHPCFERTHTRTTPAASPGWALETAADVEWTHAISPMADVLLVEAQNDQVDELLAAVDLAVRSGADIVEMSWGTEEMSVELTDDIHFAPYTVAFVAATGDAPGVFSYPAASPYVIAVGGTSLVLGSQGQRASENGWSHAGGGVSHFEPQPHYQARESAPFSVRMRTVPDVAANAAIDSGYAVTTSDGIEHLPRWSRTGGSSGAAVVWAALLSLGTADCSRRTTEEPYGAQLYQDVMVNGRPHQYDLETGLGPPDAQLLMPSLCAPRH